MTLQVGEHSPDRRGASGRGRGEARGLPGPTTCLLPGDHACWFFRSPAEHREGVTAFVRQGLDSGGKVVYLADEIPAATVAGYLRAAALDPDALAEEGRLVLLSLEEGYLRDGAFDPHRQMALYRDLLDRAAAEGHRGVWITGEGTWELRGDIPGSERYLEYERLVEGMFARREDAVVLCQYDAALMGAHVHGLRGAHNLELADGSLRALPRSVPGLRVAPGEGGISLSGEVDVATWAVLSNALRRLAFGSARGDLAVDLRGVSFMDVRGVSLLAEVAEELDGSSRLVLRGAPRILLRVAAIMGLDRHPRLVFEPGGRHAR